jgi:hypothetical protein
MPGGVVGNIGTVLAGSFLDDTTGMGDSTVYPLPNFSSDSVVLSPGSKGALVDGTLVTTDYMALCPLGGYMGCNAVMYTAGTNGFGGQQLPVQGGIPYFDAAENGALQIMSAVPHSTNDLFVLQQPSDPSVNPAWNYTPAYGNWAGRYGNAIVASWPFGMSDPNMLYRIRTTTNPTHNGDTVVQYGSFDSGGCPYGQNDNVLSTGHFGATNGDGNPSPHSMWVLESCYVGHSETYLAHRTYDRMFENRTHYAGFDYVTGAMSQEENFTNLAFSASGTGTVSPALANFNTTVGQVGMVWSTQGDMSTADLMQWKANDGTIGGRADYLGKLYGASLAGFTAAAGGAIGYDTTNKNTHVYSNGADALVGVFASAPTTGQCVTETVSGGTVILSAAGAACSTTLSGTTSSIGGGALLAGACATGTAIVTGATTSMAVSVSPAGGVDPTNGAVLGVSWNARVSAANTVTVSVCSPIAGTPAAAAYNVRVN